MAIARLLLASGTFWSGALCMSAFNRGTAYIERPPESQTFSSGAIEAFMPYSAWGALLLLMTAAIIVGHIFDSLKSLAIFGHIIGVAAYGTFAFSVLGAALIAGQTWAGFGSLVMQALLHVARAIFIGDEIAKQRTADER